MILASQQDYCDLGTEPPIIRFAITRQKPVGEWTLKTVA